jgi:hypothetical protein
MQLILDKEHKVCHSFLIRELISYLEVISVSSDSPCSVRITGFLDCVHRPEL